MDWLNCNICCRQPGEEKDKVFLLSSCGHLFCNICLSKAESREKCMVCSTHCQFIHLSSKMKPDAQIFFQDPTKLVLQHQKQLIRVLEFQKEHRARLISFHRKMLSHYKEMENKCRIAMEKHDKLQRENAKLKKLLDTAIVGGGQEYGDLVKGGYSQFSPHGSYERTRTASGSRISPQASVVSVISPGASNISPGRLSLSRERNYTLQRGPVNLPSLIHDGRMDTSFQSLMRPPQNTFISSSNNPIINSYSPELNERMLHHSSLSGSNLMTRPTSPSPHFPTGGYSQNAVVKPILHQEMGYANSSIHPYSYSAHRILN